MLAAHRIRSFPCLNARLEDHFILHRDFRIVVWVREGVVQDDQVLVKGLGQRSDSPRSNLLIALSDPVGVRSGGQEIDLVEGSCLAEWRRSGWSLRQERRSVTLLVDWHPGTIGGPVLDPAALVRLSSKALARLRKAARTFVDPGADASALAREVAATLEVLRAEGAPFSRHRAGELIESVPASTARLSAALDRSLSALPERPMWADLESRLRLSSRQLQRELGSFLERYHFVSSTWRDLLRRERLAAGAALMSTPEGTTESVASLLGYSSPTAFCRAFASAGLPSPGSIRGLL